MSLKSELLELIENYLENTIYELVDLIYQREGYGWVLRILIDKEGGIQLDDCTIVSKAVSAILDEDEDLYNRLDDSYSLEVSSPGVNRPLIKLNDFDRFKDNDVKIVLHSPIDLAIENRIRYKGYLKGIVNNDIILILDDKEILIDFNLIKKANIIYKF